MKKRLLALSRLYGSSSSDEEFWLKAAVEGASFPVKLLFRACMFRRKHPKLELLELALFGFGVAGFSLWGGLAGPKNPLGGVGILLLALAVLVPAELLIIKFETFCRRLFGKDRPE